MSGSSVIATDEGAEDTEEEEEGAEDDEDADDADDVEDAEDAEAATEVAAGTQKEADRGAGGEVDARHEGGDRDSIDVAEI